MRTLVHTIMAPSVAVGYELLLGMRHARVVQCGCLPLLKKGHIFSSLWSVVNTRFNERGETESVRSAYFI